MMDTQLEVPEGIAVLISAKKRSMQDEQKQKELQQEQKRKEDIEVGRTVLRLRIAEALIAVPEWLRPYDVTESEWDDDNLERVGKGYIKLNGFILFFDIPGLAPIQYETKETNWRAAQAHSQWKEYGPEIPKLGFTNSCYWRSDLEYTLIEAEASFREFQKMQVEYEKRLEDDRRRQEEEMLHEQKVEACQYAKEQVDEIEEKELFDIFKDDPIAVHLLKAFLAIRQERSMFECQIEDANSTMYSLEERYSRKAEDLRRQAKYAERRAEEERNRASDLEDDLSKANKKIKSQGW
jgi:hypothetical protein